MILFSLASVPLPLQVFGGLVWTLVATLIGTLATLDVFYHFVAVCFYLRASVILAYFTIGIGLGPSNVVILKIYRLAISAVVMSFLATLFYFLHAIFSAIRWKRS
uniref:Uncharacterized protein n=1 Tax=Monopterus albus TaxID=43700 RepID=A0A3Q3R982_MONAL